MLVGGHVLDFETSAGHYTSSKRGNTQVQQMRAVEELLQELIRHSDAWPFLKPVDKKLVGSLQSSLWTKIGRFSSIKPVDKKIGRFSSIKPVKQFVGSPQSSLLTNNWYFLFFPPPPISSIKPVNKKMLLFFFFFLSCSSLQIGPDQGCWYTQPLVY